MYWYNRKPVEHAQWSTTSWKYSLLFVKFENHKKMRRVHYIEGIAFALTLILAQSVASEGTDLSEHETIIGMKNSSNSEREGKLCTTTTTTTSSIYNGTCMTSAECTTNGGTGYGSCASGFGVCCVIILRSCGTTTSLNNTYWQNPGYDSAYTTAGQCVLYINVATDIGQIRLDFVSFILAAPDATLSTAGQCLTDSFFVTGAFNPVPVICGTNTNQHMYLDLAPTTNSASLTIITTGTTTSRYWSIRITHIPDGTFYTAPDNCLQWYTDPTGTIQSFNFIGAATPVVQHLAYQDYTICIRANQGYCGIKYALCSTSTYNFGLTSKDASTAATTPYLDQSCSTDWIQIPCASDQANSALTAAPTGCASKICGAFFAVAAAATASVPIYSYRRPFEVRFYTDSNEVFLTSESFGFCLGYTQQPCLSIVSSSG